MDKRVGDEAPFVAARVRDRRNTDLARHILPSSGTMIAMCTTMVWLRSPKAVWVRATSTSTQRCWELFLTSAVLAYVSIRAARFSTLSGRCERIADVLFLAGLASSVFIVVMFAIEII